VGIVGNTGDARTTPTHLHFELKPGGGPSVDSYYTLKKWC
jgi:murein DD-endopeptidase MepM/ murein hydrolase activator NlpD